ncbi:MAG: NADH-quinone oxidoreductase subunit H, partial [Bacteroidetes bacterium]|nr:NADH-quinone oxidoreductase subunit H [Bacteroidota bacterium]
MIETIHNWLYSVLPEGTASIAEMVLIALIYLGIFSIVGLFLVLMERRVAAWFQLRVGPNRVGFQGILQTMADAL